MTDTTRRIAPARALLGMAAALLFVPVLAVGAFAADQGQSELAAVRAATAKYHDIEVAKADGYGEFYLCTDENGGAGAMGQHYANIDRVLDPSINALEPEVLTYEPMPNGELRLVGVEYVVFQDLWHENFGAGDPSVLGHTLKPVGSSNRYGLPAFYELHAWIWRPNPRGMFDDWNSKVTCRGNGDPA